MSLLPLDDLPGPLPGPLSGPLPGRLPAQAPASGAVRSAPVRSFSFSSSAAARLACRLLALLPLLLIGAWAVLDWPAVSEGAARLASADPSWLLAALFFTCLGWVSAACVRQGAIPERLPPGLLVASQFAAGAANHVLPANLGAHAVTLRFLQGRGIPLARATASLALYSLVRPIAKTLVLLVFLLALPGLVRPAELLPAELLPDEQTLFVAAGGATAGLAATALLVTAVRPLRRPVLGFLRTALTDVRLLHTRPSRALALWGGAASAPVLQASVIFCVGAALGLPLSWAQVVFAFLAASTAVGAVPAPGGIGPVDAALVFTMAAFGTPLDLATTTVIGYRVLTVWLPLLPGALVLSALVHRKVL